MFKYGLNGVKLSFKNSKLLLIYILFIVAFFMCSILKVSPLEWIVVFICSSTLMSLELLNTCIELLCNQIDPNVNPNIKIIKDISSGAVLLFTFYTFLIGCIIFIPKLVILF